MSTPLLSIVVPVLNEEDGLLPLVERLRPVLEKAGLDWEVVFVDDGSTDATLAALRVLNEEDRRFKTVSLSRNFGKEVAIAAGLRYVRGDAAVILDADLQHPPEMIPAFVAEWRAGHNIVYGQRTDRSTDGAVRRVLTRGFYRLFQHMTRTELPEGAGDFRLLDRKAIDAMNRLGEAHRFNKGLYSWIGFRTKGLPYTVAERFAGKSRWSPRRLFGFALDGLTSFSTVPLRVWSLVGAILSLSAFTYAAVFLVRTMLFGVDVPGFPTLIISVMLFSGVQLISLGVLGEYIGRVYDEVKARPLFLVGEEIGIGESAGLAAGRTPAGEPARPVVRVRAETGEAAE